MSHVSGHVWWFTVPQKKHPIALNPIGTQDLGSPQKHHETWSIFESISKATKTVQIGPKATQNHQKRTLESSEIQFLRKLICAITPLPNACFCNPNHPISDPKIIRKNNLEINMDFLSKRIQKSLKMAPPNHQQIDKIRAWTSQSPSLCPPMSQDRPKIVPGSPRTQSRGTKHAK